MDGHVPEDPAGLGKIGCRGLRRVAAGDQQLFQCSDFLSSHATLQLHKVPVKALVETQDNWYIGSCCPGPEGVHTGNIKVDGLLTKHRHVGVDRLLH